MTLILKDCRILSVATGEILPGDIAIDGGVIRAILPVGEGCGDRVIDCGGKYASPGFADAHFHSESTLLSLPHLTELLLRKGTTTLYINPHEAANVGGLDAVKSLLRESTKLPMHIYVVAPCKVPTAPGLEHSGACFGLKELEEMLSWPETVGIGEIDAYKLLHPSEPYASFIKKAHEHRLAVCGSVSGLSGEQLQKCMGNGVTDDHESVTGDEALEKLRSGCFLHVREGSTEHNLAAVLNAVSGHPECFSQLCFCCDDKTAGDLMDEGHIDTCIRKAIALGIKPLWAYRMATFNTACYYGQAHSYGLIAPGRAADILLLDDLEQVHITDMFFAGRQVMADGELLWKPDAEQALPESQNTIRWPRPLIEKDLSVLCQQEKLALAHVVRVIPGQIVNKLETAQLPVREGVVCCDPKRDIQYFTLAERYHGRSETVNAFVGGFGLRQGALAASVSHDHHHLVSVGVCHTDMAFALNHIAQMGGGLAVVCDGKVLAQLPLPIWGLLSESDAAETVDICQKLRQAAAQLGWSAKEDPFSVLSLLSLPVIPDAGFTDMGLINTRSQMVMDVLVSAPDTEVG